MLGSKSSERLLANIRNGLPMTRGEKLRLIVSLSIPSMLAQLTTVMMFFIDASMVGHLGTAASASIGLIEPTIWLLGSVLMAASTGFSVQVAHFIGANDFPKARQVYRQALVCGMVFSLFITLVGVLLHRPIPLWLVPILLTVLRNIFSSFRVQCHSFCCLICRVPCSSRPATCNCPAS